MTDMKQCKGCVFFDGRPEAGLFNEGQGLCRNHIPSSRDSWLVVHGENDWCVGHKQIPDGKPPVKVPQPNSFRI